MITCKHDTQVKASDSEQKVVHSDEDTLMTKNVAESTIGHDIYPRGATKFPDCVSTLL